MLAGKGRKRLFTVDKNNELHWDFHITQEIKK